LIKAAFIKRPSLLTRKPAVYLLTTGTQNSLPALHIFNANAQWLAEVFDLEAEEFRYLPVDMLRDSAVSDREMKWSEQEILEKKGIRTREANLVVRLDATGIRRFKRMHPPGIVLSLTGVSAICSRKTGRLWPIASRGRCPRFRWSETAAFDRELNNNVRGLGDRPHMHVGWVSGAPYAYALLMYGRKHGLAKYAEAGAAVLDKIASGLSPCGIFWASWIVDRGWTTGWNPRKNWLQARTIAEATLFMIRALRFERERGFEHEDWKRAVLSNLRFAMEHQREDGNFGSYYDCEQGTVEEWDGAGGILWIAALLEGADVLGEPEFTRAAVRAGGYYERFVRDEYIYGAPEDVHLTPTSEDAYNAVVAYVLLYEHDRDNRWLELAASAADWMMTFRWTYNIEFPRHSLLRQYDFRSRGADQASSSNQHLHNYGLFCVPEMLRLWKYTGDAYYLERTRDHLACFLQFIAREDGDFNAYKGMVTERFYNTNCFQPKGMMLTLSHSWCVGLVLYAAQEALVWQDELRLSDISVRGREGTAS